MAMHCECNTERYVLERSLKSGGSESCGCQCIDRSREVNGYELTGKIFGDLTVPYYVIMTALKNMRFS